MQRSYIAVIAAFLFSGIGHQEAAAYDYLRGPEGQVLAWQQIPIVYLIGPLSKDLPEDLQIEAIHKSFETWQTMPNTDVIFEFGGFTDIHEPGNDGKNIVYFQQSGWEEESRAIATTHSYAFQTGELHAFDLRLNDGNYTFTATNNRDEVLTDIQNTITHEVGHILGMGHSEDVDATMYRSTGLGDIGKRILTNDDLEGVETLYPYGVLSYVDPSSGGFSCTQSPGGQPSGLLSFILGGWFVSWVRRKKNEPGEPS